MKCLPLCKSILFLLILLSSTCGDTNKNRANSAPQDRAINHLAQRQAKYKNQGLSFTDGDSLTVSHNFYSEITVDSIAMVKKEFKAIFNSCHKGQIQVKSFLVFEHRNAAEYERIKRITTAYSLYVNDVKMSFNGKESSSCRIIKGEKVFVETTVYSLFSRNMHLGNVLVIDTIVQNK